MLEVFKVGTTVSLPCGLTAVVTAVLVEGNESVRYRCLWWDGNARKSGWLFPAELRACDPERFRIGVRDSRTRRGSE